MSNQTKKTKKKTATKHDGATLFLRDIPPELKRDFKTACARKGQTMLKAMIGLMDYYINLE